jgi:PKD repeat protein
MRWTRVAAAGLLGIVLPLLLSETPAAADAEHEQIAAAIREKHPPIAWKRFEDASTGADDLDVAGIEHDLGVVDRNIKQAKAKWKAVQLRRRTTAMAESTVVYKWAHDALSWAGTVKEKEDRLADIRRREDEEYTKRFGVPYHSIFVKKGKELEWEGQWYASGRGHAYREEEKQVNAWFQQEIKERVKEQSKGINPVSKLLDELQAEAIQEIAGLRRARKNYDDALRRKRGEKVESDAAKAADDEAERHRSEIRLAPVRTEYETTTGEPIETIYQVWKGAPPYTLRASAQGAVERPLVQELAQGGEFLVPFTFRRPGTYTAKVTVFDAQAYEKSATVTITVTGEPLADEEPEGEKKPDPPGGGSRGSAGAAGAITPFHGTFEALLWGGNAGLNRWDLVDHLGKTSAPLTLTVAPDGTLSARVRYVLPESEMRPQPAKMDVGPSTSFWKTSFDLAGKVDWATGKVSISITNGHDERGYERDRYKMNDKGQNTGIFGHWRDWTKVDYTTELEGWTIPGPQATAWLSRLPKDAKVLEALKSTDLEDMLGVPALVVGADGSVAFRDRGFFGMQDLTGGTPPPDGTTPRRHRVRLHLQHQGYDGMNEKEENETAKEQARADKEAAGRLGGWYLKVLGVAPAEDTSAPPPAKEPKDDDVLAFGLWPVKPITLTAGSNLSARAMGVFGKDVNEAVDLSDRATWTASPGLVLLQGGSFSAPTPGTYTLTATMQTPNGPMSSTIQVIVTAKR